MKKLILLLLFAVLAQADSLSQYRVTQFCITTDNDEEFAIIRTFILRGKSRQLMINTHTLQTSITSRTLSMEHDCGDSHYRRYLQQSIAVPFKQQNNGITHGKKGIALTTDLCPSSKQGFEQRLYDIVIKKFPRPVPVTLFITGRWIEKHTEAFGQFLLWEKAQLLSITWGNHTYSHPYHPKVSLAQNFALSPDYDLQEDTLRLEKILIEKGVVPSVFFRFPGLVSDQKAIQTIYDLGLITIGSDTWVAKGQSVKEGSIILLHGNKNEPKGVEMFLEMLGQDKIKKLDALEKILP